MAYRRYPVPGIRTPTHTPSATAGHSRKAPDIGGFHWAARQSRRRSAMASHSSGHKMTMAHIKLRESFTRCKKGAVATIHKAKATFVAMKTIEILAS